MAKLFLESFYTFKALPAPTLMLSAREVAPPSTALEWQIYNHLVAGHQAFFKAHYQAALAEYQAAWALLPRLIEPYFPSEFATVQPDILLNVNSI